MNFVITAFIAALLYLAHAHQSAAALSTVSGMLWIFTVLHFIILLGAHKVKHKKRRPVRAFINGTLDCGISIVLVYLFGMVWLPTLFAISSVLCCSVMMEPKKEA